jgi:homoserine kinase
MRRFDLFAAEVEYVATTPSATGPGSSASGHVGGTRLGAAIYEVPAGKGRRVGGTIDR